MTLAVDMESHVERASGAAQRRRERRLHAWQRHVRTVQLALAEKLHHSACRTHLPEKEWMEQDAASRGQTARARELEMESFPNCLVRGLRLPSPSGELPTLATPQLAANETLDSAALSFLLNRALGEKEKEEEERRKREEEQWKVKEEKKAKEALSAWHARRKAVTDEMFALLDVIGRLTPAQQARKSELTRVLDIIDASKPPSLPKRRKRKKKRRRRTRRTTSR